jgi:thiosulfate/3-mercaptopyruvate sulfurtransferase
MGAPMQGRAWNWKGRPGFRGWSGCPVGRSWPARAAVGIVAGCLAGGGLGLSAGGFLGAAPPGTTTSAEPWTDSQLLGPEDLAAILARKDETHPLVICVGFQVLFQMGHIEGAQYLGPGSEPDGIQALQSYLQKQSRDAPLVLYCGCCPMADCPNIRPAMRAVQAAGFTHAKVLALPRNFKQDWVAKGFPVAKP